MTNMEDDDSRSPSPDIRQVEKDQTEVFQKGKGVGKKSKLKTVKDEETKEPETPETTDNSNASKRNLISDGKSSSPEKKKIKLEEGVTSSSQSNPSKIKKEKSVRAEPLTEDMLHGPFNFSQHRAEANNRNNRRTQNLSQELQDLVEDSSRSKKHSGILTPSRLKHFSPGLAAESPSSSSVSYSHSPSRDYIKPGKLVPPEARVTNSQSPGQVPRERVPSIEVVGEEIVENEVVEIPDVDQADIAAVNLLADNLVAIFPDTPREYIQMRCVDLVGKVAAIDRFTEELLVDPTPPENWEQIYKKPFIVVLEEKEKVPPVIEPQQSATSNEERGDPTSTSTSISGSSGSRDPADVETVQEDGAQPPPDDPTSTAASEPKQPETELDPSVSWELERHGQLLSMFPDLCPDYLLNDVVRAINKPNTADQDGSATNLNVEQLDTVFATHVERMFAMRPEEKRLLPTRSQWETKRKEKEELEKWSGNMSVNDMLLLYSDDPAGYFGNPDRKPESELYKQHAVEGLKNEFRFVFLSLSLSRF